ncbi:MAG TPA: hypothetical protein VNL77_04245, partial [Roseiflexaceae bacterium]|nr:hypothetical protein [Roseiflexaceae bacterium]
PPLLELGPFACDPARTQGVRLLRAGRAGAGGLERPRVAALALGMQLRAVGLVLIAALPWLELLPAAREDGAPVLWLVPLPALLVAVLAWGFGQLTARQAARPWALGYLWLSAALLGALVCAAAAALRERLT